LTEYSFRIRFNKALTSGITTDASELELPGDSGKPALKFKSSNPETSLKKTDRISLVGSGYSSEDEAAAAGLRYQDALTVALARNRLGADFGARAARGAFTKHGLEWVERETTQTRTLNNVHGLMTYKSEPKPLFASLESDSSYEVPLQSFLDATKLAFSRVKSLTDRERVAFTLFNAASFQKTADSRFMLLVMAVEVLLEPMPRRSEAIQHVEQLIRLTKESNLSSQEKDSMVGALGWLKTESIGQAGRKLANDRLAGRTFDGMTPDAFFMRAYTMRSNLAHGNLPLPTFEEVSATAATLELFVSELLTTPHIGPAP